MSKELSERRLAENQVIFKRANERIPKELIALKAEALSHGHRVLAHDIRLDLSLHFYCECSNPDCRMRFVTTASEYVKVHRNKKHFMLLPGHELSEVEHVVATRGNYNIVEKFKTPPESAKHLNTDIL